MSYLTEDEKTRIDEALKTLFDTNPTYGEFMDSLIVYEELNEREKIIAAFIAGETTTRLSITERVLEAIGQKNE